MNANKIFIPSEIHDFTEACTIDSIDKFISTYSQTTFQAQESFESYKEYCTRNWIEPVNNRIYSSRLQELWYNKVRKSEGNQYIKKIIF